MKEWRWRCALHTSTAQDLKEKYFGLSILMPGMKNPRMPFDCDAWVAVVDENPCEAWATAAEDVKYEVEKPDISEEISRRCKENLPCALSMSKSIWSTSSPGTTLREAAALCFLWPSDGDMLLIDLRELLNAPIDAPPVRSLLTEFAERPKIFFIDDSMPMCGGLCLSPTSMSRPSSTSMSPPSPCDAAEAEWERKTSIVAHHDSL
jgi:hypothetical protein